MGLERKVTAKNPFIKTQKYRISESWKAKWNEREISRRYYVFMLCFHVDGTCMTFPLLPLLLNTVS